MQPSVNNALIVMLKMAKKIQDAKRDVSIRKTHYKWLFGQQGGGAARWLEGPSPSEWALWHFTRMRHANADARRVANTSLWRSRPG